MPLRTETPLSHRERLARGLAYSAAGPVDVARGAVGLSGAAVYRGGAELRRRYRESRLAHRVATELAVVQDVAAGRPDLLQGRLSRYRLRPPWVIAGAIAAALLAGGIVAVLIRRSSQPEESSPRPPSVDAHPRL